MDLSIVIPRAMKTHERQRAQSGLLHASLKPSSSPGETIQSDINCSVDLRSTTAVRGRRYSRMRNPLCRSVYLKPVVGLTRVLLGPEGLGAGGVHINGAPATVRGPEKS